MRWRWRVPILPLGIKRNDNQVHCLAQPEKFVQSHDDLFSRTVMPATVTKALQ